MEAVCLRNPISVFYIWEGGLAIHGGNIFAAVLFGLYYFNKHSSIDGLRVADVAFPNVLLGQVIGRWGNFINQEAFGSVVSAEYMSHFPKFIQDECISMVSITCRPFFMKEWEI